MKVPGNRGPGTIENFDNNYSVVPIDGAAHYELHGKKSSPPMAAPTICKPRRTCAFCGGFNRSMQHFILKLKRWSVGNGIQNPNFLYGGAEDGDVGSLATRRIAQGDWACL